MQNCVFCLITKKESPANIVHEWDDCIAFVPINPVVDGHILVVPKQHVSDALENPAITGAVFIRASELANGQCNLITSVGKDATQSIFHLHIHIVPRKEGDNLQLPWSNQKRHLTQRAPDGLPRAAKEDDTEK